MKKPACLLIALLISMMALAQSVSIGDILCTDGTTVKPSAFPSSGKTAEGIVFYVDQNGQEGWAVNLNCDAIDINWVSPEYYGEGYDIPLLPNHETSRSALFDLDGYSNTAAIRMTHGPEWYPAAWSVDFDNGWYLPAAGQMRLLLSHVKEMNESLAIVNGTPFEIPYPDMHWTSTEMSSHHAIFVSKRGTVSAYMKYNYLNVYNVGVRSVKDFTCNSSPTHKIGDVVTAPGGQKGIVYYVAPDEKYYWLVALNDLPQQYKWGSDTDIPDLENIDEDWYKVHSEQNGCEATKTMREAQGPGSTYAANQVDFDNGWHLPSSGEITKLYASLPYISQALTQNGGTVPNRLYWTSTEFSDGEAWGIDFGIDPTMEGIFRHYPKQDQYNIRPVWCQPCSIPIIQNEFSVQACDSYTWNDSTYTQSGDYQQTFTSVQEYDSIVTLHLTILAGPNVSEIQGEQNIYIESGGLFTYSIDSVSNAFGYDWFIDNGWTVSSTPNSPQCTVNVNTKGRGTLTVRVYCECGVIERTLLIRHDFEAGIKIFPNPNSGKFNIQLYGIEGKTVIEAFDYLGQLIDRFEVQSTLHGITIPYSLSGKASGVYVISITNGYEHYNAKVVKYYAGSYGMIHY